MVREMGKKGLFAVQITERLGLTQRKHAEMMTIDLDLRDAYDDAARSAIAFWIDWLQDKLLNNKAIQHGAYQMMMTNLANWGAKSIADSTSAVEVIVKGGDQIGLPDGAHALNPTPNLHEISLMYSNVNKISARVRVALLVKHRQKIERARGGSAGSTPPPHGPNEREGGHVLLHPLSIFSVPNL